MTEEDEAHKETLYPQALTQSPRDGQEEEGTTDAPAYLGSLPTPSHLSLLF